MRKQSCFQRQKKELEGRRNAISTELQNFHTEIRLLTFVAQAERLSVHGLDFTGSLGGRSTGMCDHAFNAWDHLAFFPHFMMGHVNANYLASVVKPRIAEINDWCSTPHILNLKLILSHHSTAR